MFRRTVRIGLHVLKIVPGAATTSKRNKSRCPKAATGLRAVRRTKRPNETRELLTVKFFSRMPMKSSLARVSLLAVASALTAFAFASEGADLAKADLAKRMKIKPAEVKVISEIPVTWTDGGLGLPKPGEMVTKALVPGTIVELEAKTRKFRYTTGGKAIRFGGPVALDGNSLLYLEPVENEPNMNGNLMQVSAVGTNPKVLIAGVGRYTVGKDGSVLAVRRTSRSGHELLCLSPKASKAVKLGAAFDYGLCEIDEKGVNWAAIRRPSLGSTWEVVVSKIGSKEENVVAAPAKSVFKRLLWQNGRLLLQTATGWFEIGKECAKIDAPLIEDDMWTILNKSESLEIDTQQVNGKPVTRVAKVWFTGDRNELASIAGFEVKSFEPIGGGWVLLSGKQGNEEAAYIVDLAYGMVVPVLKGKLGEVHGLNRPSAPMVYLAE
jgi:hypothetical protein